MSETSPKPSVTEPAASTPSAMSLPHPCAEGEALQLQRRFRLAGSGMASRELQSAILAFLQQKGT
jgi:hypothetical protein